MNDPRQARFRRIKDEQVLDVLVVGGGMSGAPVYQKLRLAGYRTALIDKGDFSSGTSQASGMLVWGGLLYLATLDIGTVFKLCRARRDLLRQFPREVAVLDLDYRLQHAGHHVAAFVWSVLQLYWLMGGCSLRRPRHVHEPPAIRYQEAMLQESDSRFVIDHIRGFDCEHGIPLNHCRLVSAEFDRSRRVWNVVIRDEVSGTECVAKSRSVINAAGVWADEVNRILGVNSPFKHVFSKGVYLAFPNQHPDRGADVYRMHGRSDVLTRVPWGPVMMWGPTETSIDHLDEGFTPNRDDIRFLLAEAARCLDGPPGAEDVVSIRCGVRPLAVPANFNRNVYPLTLSRRHQLVANESLQTIAIYGGKLTGSLQLADEVVAGIRRWLAPRFPAQPTNLATPERAGPGNFVTPGWARDHEFCVNLEDYLRRRTPIAQWTPRMGLGHDGSNRGALLNIASELAADPAAAATMVAQYEAKVRSTYDPLLDL